MESCLEVVRDGGKEGVLGKEEGKQETVGVRHPQQDWGPPCRRDESFAIY